MSSTGHGIPVDPLPAFLSLKQTETLQAGIRNALVTEAMDWVGDYRVPVWMAMIGAAERMGITITKDELYQMLSRQGNTEGQRAP